ncbi:uncharacterized protein LOC113774572 [Coffea eugenioides]|uniref:uncharacterized protein LOC113774543 n=1 Tax=Coffea eugenioides TaxID=49369 RepID=UPI000F605E2F|nr:uncharacterized protein LOC113774543 [Coffea eugenioides]XP_027174925.1 uncharacterized protein LOC113774572 [Coffea eugenioides]
MDIRLAFGSISSYTLRPDSRNRNAFSFIPYCSRKDSKRQPQQNGNNDGDDRNGGDKFSTDWDKAWSSYRKRGKKTLFSQFSDKYVSWNPRRSDYPLSEEVDPIKRTEKSNLKLWTSQSFTLGGAILIVTLLLIYTILAPIK